MSDNTDENDTLHLFDPLVARTYGLEAAVVYQYIRWVCGRRGQFSVTRKTLLERFPYIGRKSLINALALLLNPRRSFAPALLVRTSKNTNPTYMLTPSARTEKYFKRKDKLHSFDPKMALKYGIPAAIVHDDICRWISHNEDIDGEEVPSEHFETPAQWASTHPYLPLRTVERAFTVLRRAEELIFTGYVRGRRPSWLIPHETLKRYRKLHAWAYKKRKPKKPKVKVVYKYVPVLADPDLAGENGTQTFSKSHRQNGTPHRQNGTPHRQKGTPDRQKGTPDQH
jgi:hypothetical protein